MCIGSKVCVQDLRCVNSARMCVQDLWVCKGTLVKALYWIVGLPNTGQI